MKLKLPPIIIFSNSILSICTVNVLKKSKSSTLGTYITQDNTNRVTIQSKNYKISIYILTDNYSFYQNILKIKLQPFHWVGSSMAENYPDFPLIYVILFLSFYNNAFLYLSGLEVKVVAQNVRDMGLNPTWFQFFQVIRC